MFSTASILIAAVVAGALAAAALAAWPWARRRGRFAVAGLATALGFVAWNATLNVTNATGFDVDAPLVRVSWQDAGSGVAAFALGALVLAYGPMRSDTPRAVTTAALAIGAVALVVDVYLY